MKIERSSAQERNDAKDRFILRFHEVGQRDVLKIRAAKNHRTLNAELLLLIEKGLELEDGRKNEQH